MLLTRQITCCEKAINQSDVSSLPVLSHVWFDANLNFISYVSNLVIRLIYDRLCIYSSLFTLIVIAILFAVSFSNVRSRNWKGFEWGPNVTAFFDKLDSRPRLEFGSILNSEHFRMKFEWLFKSSFSMPIWGNFALKFFAFLLKAPKVGGFLLYHYTFSD